MPSASNHSSQRNSSMLENHSKSPRDVPHIRHECKPTMMMAGGMDRPTPTADLFGCHVYSMAVMEHTLPKPIFAKLCKKMAGGPGVLDKETADAVAHGVKVWAMERGATHFTHWFQPQNNRTAEKHDSFPSLRYEFENSNLKVSAFDAFSGSQLVQAEPDASSFPHGGIRTTFEARGYTVWDTTSPMFLRDGPHDTKVLYIPSVFISYTGEALDEKTVLLRSCQAISEASRELIHLVSGEEVSRVHVTLGTEQEFFLIDRNKYTLRPDIRMTGRSLFGCAPPKHQQLEDHYFGQMPSRVLAAMSEAEFELWKLGVPLKTRHNEVAPRQFEVAPIFEEASVAVDHNHLTMDVISKVAHRHGLKALFHEKPFKGINGSGKHCNWALSTDKGVNLLEPTENPEDNLVFLAVLTSLLIGMDKHGGLLNCAIASASNEHRLGAHEAPPAIISAFLGEHIDAVLQSITNGAPMRRRASTFVETIDVGVARLNLKVAHLPEVKKDSTDRNRTSPMAFTGNKFEFRAVGSSQSPSFPVAIMNSIAASGMRELSAAMKKANGGKPLTREAFMAVLIPFLKQTAHVRFEGNNYSEEWVKEAMSRGLLNAKNAPQAFMELIRPQNKQALVNELGILSESELMSRFCVMNEKYVQHLVIEAKSIGRLALQNISPVLFRHCKDVAAGISVLTNMVGKVDTMETRNLSHLLATSTELADTVTAMDQLVARIESIEEASEAAMNAAQHLKPLISKTRKLLDTVEEALADDVYPFPKYRELLF